MTDETQPGASGEAAPRGEGAAHEWGQGLAGGYGRSADYGRGGGTGRWQGADAGTPAAADASGERSLVAEHWVRDEEKSGTALFPVLLGVGIGAALVYFLDSERGAGRRQRITEQARELAGRWPSGSSG